ncbi:hypothetical protein EDEG_02735 [Edhazardia aedis USNM 41457]|uniref:Uncharacterized protein n=1 Tax=Edhazardia aedis (strain USNM 41457) TaxID=1003232 RepID=J9DJQ3_EDHAE|nr:hypothetical protein EDEG_02735 [Edhazardia aedis USNM 41457]|eukprot:EJW02855.1 hypothetical protein EDEG_02735 [Edhazardia aedis USNM 41457]
MAHKTDMGNLFSDIKNFISTEDFQYYLWISLITLVCSILIIYLSYIYIQKRKLSHYKRKTEYLLKQLNITTDRKNYLEQIIKHQKDIEKRIPVDRYDKRIFKLSSQYKCLHENAWLYALRMTFWHFVIAQIAIDAKKTFQAEKFQMFLKKLAIFKNNLLTSIHGCTRANHYYQNKYNSSLYLFKEMISIIDECVQSISTNTQLGAEEKIKSTIDEINSNYEDMMKIVSDPNKVQTFEEIELLNIKNFDEMQNSAVKYFDLIEKIKN